MANITTVMDDIGTALATITGLRVYDFPPKSAQPPFAFVDMPDEIAFDCTYQRGSDRTTLNVVVAVADVVDRMVRDQIAAYAAGSGAKSVKAVIEAATIGQTVRVVSCKFQPVQVAGVFYFGAVFELDIVF
jgi:hypothetical protein